ncbi:MAG: chemotaxis protein CheD [Paracoccaceae bacterium]
MAKTTLITQGQQAVSKDPDEIITTLLGSCVSCCLWDDVAGIGGMNHMLLGGVASTRISGYDVAGVADMELLINGLIKLGASKSNLQAKLFGGSQMIASKNAIGQKNVEFTMSFLKEENIPCVNSSVGGTSARSLKFWPTTGRVSMRLVTDRAPEVVVKPPVQAGNDMELF